jgi:hypothetical protein
MKDRRKGDAVNPQIFFFITVLSPAAVYLGLLTAHLFARYD